VATFLDIRGFSTFSARGESFDSALYLRSVYSTILGSYFDDADFFKPTGDGLLIIHELPGDAQQVPAIVSSILTRAVALIEEFGQLTADDYMVNFATPQKLGIGLARGSVTRLVSDGFVLDYTGRCLNLAARLMDKARPAGVVFGDTHARQLMEPDIATAFSEDQVCIRGISEEVPVAIFVTGSVDILPADRAPIPQSRTHWGEPMTLPVDEIRGLSTYGFHLPRAPRSNESAGVHVTCPVFDNDGKRKDSVVSFNIDGRIEEHPGGTVIYASMKRVNSTVKSVPATTTSKFWNITKHTTVTFTPFCAPRDDE
jgi:class 3 adenylate cyclase